MTRCDIKEGIINQNETFPKDFLVKNVSSFGIAVVEMIDKFLVYHDLWNVWNTRWKPQPGYDRRVKRVTRTSTADHESVLNLINRKYSYSYVNWSSSPSNSISKPWANSFCVYVVSFMLSCGDVEDCGTSVARRSSNDRSYVVRCRCHHLSWYPRHSSRHHHQRCTTVWSTIPLHAVL